MKIWKRNAVVSVIVLFVCLALYLSWSYGRTPEEGETDVFDPGAGPLPTAQGEAPSSVDQDPEEPELGESPYFNQVRLSRKNARDDALSILSDAAANDAASQEIRDNASQEITQLAQNALSEANIENLIIAKGFNECVAFINQDGIKVVVSQPEGGMTDSDANIIADIVIQECNVPASDINVVPVEA